MPYIPCQFSRHDYLEHAQLFEDIKIDDAENELCEFNKELAGKNKGQDPISRDWSTPDEVEAWKNL